MKHSITIMAAGAIAAGILSAGLTSCEPDNCTLCAEEGLPSTLSLTLEPTATRSTSAQSETQDNTINTLDVFIFRNGEPTSADYGKLDTYTRFEGESLNDLTLETTTGPKLICIIVNSNISTYAGITTLDAFRSLTTRLQDETLGDFTMYGESSQTLGVTTSVSISVTRLISRICVTSIKTDFADNPYVGMSLTNCRLYLVNAHGEKHVYNGGSPTEATILNPGGLVGEHVNSTLEAGLLMDNITEAIGDNGYSTAHYLYCFANETSDIASSTKLVLQADLDGVTYYYPIPVNQDGYGHVDDGNGNTYFGVRGNSIYSYGITVTRPGSLDPDTPVVPGTLELSISTAEWNVIPHFDKVF